MPLSSSMTCTTTTVAAAATIAERHNHHHRRHRHRRPGPAVAVEFIAAVILVVPILVMTIIIEALLLTLVTFVVVSSCFVKFGDCSALSCRVYVTAHTSADSHNGTASSSSWRCYLPLSTPALASLYPTLPSVPIPHRAIPAQVFFLPVTGK